MKNKKLLIAIIALIVIIIIIIRNGVVLWSENQNSVDTEVSTDSFVEEDVLYNSDYENLLSQQDELELRFGSVPDGFLWQANGDLLSIGDPSMSAEEAMYAYFQGLSSLDFGTAQRYSRNSRVVETYSDYFSSTAVNSDYYDQFLRNMYRECLLSIQILGVLNTSTFAENRVVFTVSARMLDLTNKDFWKEDEMEIFRSLYVYSLESDSTASDIYLYDYILNYYRSDEAKLRDVTFDITLERFPDVMSGWLVCLDSDVDDACSYRDGTLVASYIMSEYRDRGADLVDAEMHPETDTEILETEILEQSRQENTPNSITQESEPINNLQDLGSVDLENSDPVTFDEETEAITSSSSSSNYNYYLYRFTEPDTDNLYERETEALRSGLLREVLGTEE